VNTSCQFCRSLFRSKVVLSESRFERTKESVQSISIELIYQICVKIFSLAVDALIYESQFLSSLTLLSKPLLRSNWPYSSDRINSRSKQPSIELVITWYRFSPHCCSNEVNIAAVSGSTQSSLQKMQRGSHNVHEFDMSLVCFSMTAWQSVFIPQCYNYVFQFCFRSLMEQR